MGWIFFTFLQKHNVCVITGYPTSHYYAEVDRDTFRKLNNEDIRGSLISTLVTRKNVITNYDDEEWKFIFVSTSGKYVYYNEKTKEWGVEERHCHHMDSPTVQERIDIQQFTMQNPLVRKRKSRL
jgi:hypothetical protein